jgi:NADH:ubiquinone oxidoreductase subunit E
MGYSLVVQHGKHLGGAMKSKSLSCRNVLLVCKGGKCADCKGRALYSTLKAELKDRGLHKRVKVMKVDCLGNCKESPNVLSCADNTMYSKVKPKDLDALLDRLETVAV